MFSIWPNVEVSLSRNSLIDTLVKLQAGINKPTKFKGLSLCWLIAIFNCSRILPNTINWVKSGLSDRWNKNWINCSFWINSGRVGGLSKRGAALINSPIPSITWYSFSSISVLALLLWAIRDSLQSYWFKKKQTASLRNCYRVMKNKVITQCLAFGETVNLKFF